MIHDECLVPLSSATASRSSLQYPVCEGVKRDGIVQNMISPGVLCGHERAFWGIMGIDIGIVRLLRKRESKAWRRN